MAFVRALRSGFWNDTNTTTSPWASAGQLFQPGPLDDVFSNSFTIFVSGSFTVNSASNSNVSRVWLDSPAAPATTCNVGGRFILTENSTLAALVSSHNTNTTTEVVLFSGNRSANIVGVVNKERSIDNAMVINSGVGNLNITGNILGGASTVTNGHAVLNSGTGNINHVGNILGGTGSSGRGIQNTAVGTIRTVGNVTGGTGSGAIGINNTSVGQVLVFGNVQANSNGAYAIQSTNASSLVRITGNITNASNGVAAIYAPLIRIQPVPVNSFINYGTLNMFTADHFSTFSVPPATAVRANTPYAAGTLVGTCHIPPISAVSFGTKYDINESRIGISYNNANVIFNTLVSQLSTPNSIGDRLRKAATVETTGHLVASFSN